MQVEGENDYQKIVSFQPDFTSVSDSIILDNLVDEYHNQDLKGAFSGLSRKYNRYRKIRGDGNCFIRAVAFGYLASKGKVDFQSSFDKIDSVNFENIKDIPGTSGEKIINKKTNKFQSQDRYISINSDENKKKMFKKVWQKKFGQYFHQSNDYKKSLMNIMNKHQFIDIMIILYFRAVCIAHFEERKDEYKVFYQSQQQFLQVERKLKTYGQQSEGFIIKCMTDALQCKLLFSQVDKKNLFLSYDTEPQIPPNGEMIQISLFFRPGHYDYLEGNVQKEQKQDIENRKAKQMKSLMQEQISQQLLQEQQIIQQRQYQNRKKLANCIRCFQLIEQKISEICFQCQIKRLKLSSEQVFKSKSFFSMNESPKSKIS